MVRGFPGRILLGTRVTATGKGGMGVRQEEAEEAEEAGEKDEFRGFLGYCLRAAHSTRNG